MSVHTFYSVVTLLCIVFIGTHDILNATTTETDDDAIVITTLYSEHSDARGALFDFVFIDGNGDVNFTRSVLLALDRNTSLHHTLPFNLYPGQYRVYVYDIESDGTLSNGVGYPAVINVNYFNTTSFFDEIDEDGQGTKYRVIITIFHILNILLEFLNDSSLTVSSCLILAVCMNMNGFQMIVQSAHFSEVHKLHINQSMDFQTPVTVEMEESGVYQVTIFEILDSNATHVE